MALPDDNAHAFPIAQSLRRSRSRWRAIAFIALVIAVLAFAARFSFVTQGDTGDQIARVKIEGVITTDAGRLRILTDLADSDRVKAVIVAINSPGGSTAGGEELYEAISAIRAKKPVAVVIHELGASAAYMTAIAGDRIFARRLSIVGSIGVLFQHINAGKLLDTIGIGLDKVATGPLKAEPDLNEPLEGAVRQSMQALVDDSFTWFVDIVSERRGIDRPTTLALADGRIVTGQMAIKNHLIDAIGSEAEAITWLETEKSIKPDLPIVTQFPLPLSDAERLLRFVGSQALSATGLSASATMPLDGLISLWQVGPSL